MKEHPETFKEANIDKVLEKVRIGKKKTFREA